MAKKATPAPKSADPVTVWTATRLCRRRGCNREHGICVEAQERPADEDRLAYICPTTRTPTGFRFGTVTA
jgi:hypothetical protein